MLLGELIAGLGVRGGESAASLRICDLTEDSRTVVPGSLFIARAGLQADGKRYIDDAVAAGAVAVLTDDASPGSPRGITMLRAADVPLASALLAERFYGDPARRLKLVGVSGTNGKTTTTYLLWQILNHAASRCGLVGTVLIDDGREVAPAAMTTPPAVELSRTLATMADHGCTAAALEVSSHALDQKRADGLAFAVGIFTNLTGDHLDYHSTMDAYAAAKGRLFAGLGADATAIVNASDPWAERVTAGCRARVVECGPAGRRPARQRGEWCQYEVFDESMDGMHLRLSGPWGEIEARVGLIGRYNAMNILQACAAANVLGVGAAELVAALGRVTAPPGRLERVSAPGAPVAVFVDYAHSDDSLRNVLAAVRAVMPGRESGRLAAAAGAGPSVSGAARAGRLWAVFGCGGDRDRTKRPRMGRAAAELADAVVVTSDNPRTEKPGAIIDEILAGIAPAQRSRVEVQADRARAIRHAIESAEPGDVVVIAGKGHETEQVLRDDGGAVVRTHFDDREIAREALGISGLGTSALGTSAVPAESGRRPNTPARSRPLSRAARP